MTRIVYHNAYVHNCVAKKESKTNYKTLLKWDNKVMLNGGSFYIIGMKKVLRYHPESEWSTKVDVSITYSVIKMQAVIVVRENFEICE